MSVSVNEALSLEIFKNAKVVAGHKGLDNKISFVDVIEVPDFANWIKKNTLLLTTAFATQKNEDKFIELVNTVVETGAAALGIKVGRFIDAIPEKVLIIANQLNFPIIVLPLEVAYSDIINSIFTSILNKQTTLLRLGDELHQHLNKMLLVGGGLNAVVDTLRQVINKPIFIENHNGDLLAFSATEDDLNVYISLTESRKLERENFEVMKGESPTLIKNSSVNQILVPILAGRKIYGLLVILLKEDDIEEFIMEAGKRSATVAALEIMKEKAIFETEIRLQRDFIDELLSGWEDDEYSLIKRAREFGWDITKEFMVLKIDIENTRKKRASKINSKHDAQEEKIEIYNLIKKVIKSNKISPIIAQLRDCFVVILDVSNCLNETSISFTERMSGEIRQCIENHFPNICLTFGIGRPVKQIQKFNQSYQEASQALRIGKMVWGKGQIYNIEEMGVYRLLFSHKDTESLKEFYNEWLERLVQYEKNTGTDLVQTLEQYYNCNTNVMLTAEKLYIHRNTLNYRLKRIKEILELNIDEHETKICLSIALKIKNLLDY